MRQSQFIGRLKKTPVLGSTQAGSPVINLELSVLERAGESWSEHIFKLTVFGDAAKRIAKQAKEGSEIVAICKPESREYTDNSGRKRRSEDHIASWIRVVVPDGGVS